MLKVLQLLKRCLLVVKINTVKMNKSSFNNKANLKYFVNNNGQVMNLTVRTNQDKALFTKLNLSKLTVNVSTN